MLYNSLSNIEHSQFYINIKKKIIFFPNQETVTQNILTNELTKRKSP